MKNVIAACCASRLRGARSSGVAAATAEVVTIMFMAFSPFPCLLCEAVEQAVAAGGAQLVRAATARHMRRVPGLRINRVREATPIDVPDHGAAEGAARPIVAS